MTGAIVSVLSWTLALLVLVSVALNVWQWWAARRFPLHRRIAQTDFAPAVTLLKPLKGCDAETEECLRSWFRQEYPGPIQILFAVASADDPAAAVANRLLAEFPQASARLAVCGELRGANAKVAKLAQLARHAEHDLWVISDADVRVPPDLIVNVVAPLREPEVGLTFCFYRLANPRTPAMRWEAVAINADFWSQVLQGKSARGLDFALGAVMATRRADMERIGGFDALADCLADDYQLGHRIAKTGQRIEICPVVVECWDPPQGWRAVWAHQLRWARTIRVSMPVGFFFSILGNATLWPLLCLAKGSVFITRYSWIETHPHETVHTTVIVNLTAGVVAACLLLRAATAHDNHRRLSPATACVRDLWFVWLKDILQFIVWAAAFVGNTVLWRGVRYHVRRDGTVVRMDSK